MTKIFAENLRKSTKSNNCFFYRYKFEFKTQINFFANGMKLTD